MKHRILLVSAFAILFVAACARPPAPAFAGRGFRTVSDDVGFELPEGYVHRSASASTYATAARTATSALVRRGYVRDEVSPELEVVVVPALRQSALQTKGGIEWNTTGPADHVVFVAVRERATGRVVYETTIAEGATETDAVFDDLPRRAEPIATR